MWHSVIEWLIEVLISIIIIHDSFPVGVEKGITRTFGNAGGGGNKQFLIASSTRSPCLFVGAFRWAFKSPTRINGPYGSRVLMMDTRSPTYLRYSSKVYDPNLEDMQQMMCIEVRWRELVSDSQTFMAMISEPSSISWCR